MATNKNTFTNAEAMTIIGKLLEVTTDKTLEEFTEKSVNDLREKFSHMVEVAQPKEREHKESAATKANKVKASECVKVILSAQKPVDWKYIAERVNGIGSSQKATAVLAYAINSGDVERVQIRGKVYYQQAGISSEEE